MTEPQSALSLAVDQVSKRFRDLWAVDRVSFRVRPGETFGLLGPNGSGKSTTLHMVTGLLRPTSGAIRLCGVAVGSKESRRHLGFAPDDLPLPVALTGEEYLALHRRLRGEESDRADLAIAEALGLAGHLDKLLGEYSHGMKRKLQLTAALSHRPNLLVLDEPYRGLDPESSALLRSTLNVFTSRGGSVVVATHDMLRAELGCDEVAILHRGRVAVVGAPELLCAQFGVAGLEEVFLISTGIRELQRERAEALNELVRPGRSTERTVTASPGGGHHV
jgi:ABC-2 type transport system ATP-binding protein